MGSKWPGGGGGGKANHLRLLPHRRQMALKGKSQGAHYKTDGQHQEANDYKWLFNISHYKRSRGNTLHSTRPGRDNIIEIFNFQEPRNSKSDYGIILGNYKFNLILKGFKHEISNTLNTIMYFDAFYIPISLLYTNRDWVFRYSNANFI